MDNLIDALFSCFQFLGIPPKGELFLYPKGRRVVCKFPISRDPPEGGTVVHSLISEFFFKFPISRDPPEGGTAEEFIHVGYSGESFQFLGIPPKGELLKQV